tara:strand:- start:309 stop:599 length:291 start_codon:yes stop_codon:yes gene_type:complete
MIPPELCPIRSIFLALVSFNAFETFDLTLYKIFVHPSEELLFNQSLFVIFVIYTFLPVIFSIVFLAGLYASEVIRKPPRMIMGFLIFLFKAFLNIL